MVNTETRFIIFFAAKDGEALYGQKQDRELTVAQTVKRLPTMQKTWVRSLGQEDSLHREYSLEKEMATHSSTLA